MRALDDLSLKLKLGLLTGLCLLLLLASSGLTLWASAQLGSALQSLYSERLPSYAFAARLERIGVDPVCGTPAEFSRSIAEDLAIWKEAVQAAGIKPQ